VAEPEAQENRPAKKPHQFHIRIDRVQYTATEEQLTGGEIRNIPDPPIGPDRDLFEVQPGKPDRQVSDTDVVEIHDGIRFFTAPSHINPGA
jgi:hypothetical protein